MPRQQRVSQDKFVTTYCHLFRKNSVPERFACCDVFCRASLLNRSNASEGKSHYVVDIGCDIIDLAR
ncbi:MAG TPA: hypothetical protein VL354_17685, partial [Spirochaetia bacterium]|nr:hypothetical protein [Spirochaetia bacterium]